MDYFPFLSPSPKGCVDVKMGKSATLATLSLRGFAPAEFPLSSLCSPLKARTTSRFVKFAAFKVRDRRDGAQVTALAA